MSRIYIFFATYFLASCTVVNSTPNVDRNTNPRNVHIINLDGTNTGVIEGERGLILIDPNFELDQVSLFESKLGNISGKPIRYVFNTHSDIDHSGNNKYFSDRGAKIVTHENAYFSSIVTNIVFAKNYQLTENNISVEAYFTPSHSYDDIIIYLPNENTLFLGDIFTNTSHPTFYSGGISGQNAALSKALKLADHKTVVIPGHGFATNKKGLLEYQDQTNELYEYVVRHHENGITYEDILEDVGYQKLMLKFNGENNQEFLSDRAVRKFIPRIIGTDLVHTVALTSEQEYRMVGKYKTSDNKIYEVVITEQGIILRRMNSFMVELLPQSETQLHMRASFEDTVTFSDLSERNKFNVIQMKVSEQRVEAVRLLNGE